MRLSRSSLAFADSIGSSHSATRHLQQPFCVTFSSSMATVVKELDWSSGWAADSDWIKIIFTSKWQFTLSNIQTQLNLLLHGSNLLWHFCLASRFCYTRIGVFVHQLHDGFTLVDLFPCLPFSLPPVLPFGISNFSWMWRTTTNDDKSRWSTGVPTVIRSIELKAH